MRYWLKLTRSQSRFLGSAFFDAHRVGGIVER